jgi:hypothetical protein
VEDAMSRRFVAGKNHDDPSLSPALAGCTSLKVSNILLCQRAEQDLALSETQQMPYVCSKFNSERSLFVNELLRSSFGLGRTAATTILPFGLQLFVVFRT